MRLGESNIRPGPRLARLGYDFYMSTNHYGVHHMKVILGLPGAAITAQAGWSERAVTKPTLMRSMSGA